MLLLLNHKESNISNVVPKKGVEYGRYSRNRYSEGDHFKTVLHLADTFLGISLMAHDFQVLQSGASWQDKLMALGDLGFNAVSDAMLLAGVGDLADIGIKIGADLLEQRFIEGNGQIAIIEDWLVIAGSQTM